MFQWFMISDVITWNWKENKNNQNIIPNIFHVLHEIVELAMPFRKSTHFVCTTIAEPTCLIKRIFYNLFNTICTKIT